MNKIASYLIPAVTLAVFVMIMQGGYYYISSGTDRHDFNRYVNQIENEIKSSQWDMARKDLQSLDSVWKKEIPRIQFHAEMDEIDSIKADLARLSGSIDVEDPEGALPELRELAEHWENLKN